MELCQYKRHHINSRITVVSFPQSFGGLQPDLHTVEAKDIANNSARTSGTILSAWLRLLSKYLSCSPLRTMDKL